MNKSTRKTKNRYRSYVIRHYDYQQQNHVLVDMFLSLLQICLVHQNFIMAPIIAYSNKVKLILLKYHLKLLEKHGAVSREVAALMSDGVYICH